MALNFPNNPTVNQVYTVDQKSWRYNGTAWNVISSGFDLSTAPSFTTVAVAGQNNIVADTSTDTLTLAAGQGIVITTNSPTDTITFTSVATTGNISIVNETINTVNSNPVTIVPNLQLQGTLRFADNTVQTTATVAGPAGPEGPVGPTGSGAGDVSSVGGGYVDNAIVRYNGTSGTSIQTSTASINDSGVITATGFSGAGSSLTALSATQLTSGTIPDARFPATLPAISGINLTSLNATNLASGTIPAARFPDTLPAISGVNLTALPATLPIASGANLTALNATQLTSGTVPVLRLGSSGTRDATTYLRGDNTWATVSGGGTASDSFATIAVAGQSSVVADSATDTLTLVAGTGITITTDAGTDTITIAGGDSFATIAVAGQSSVVADSATDTLTLVAGTGISITTDAGTDTVTITSTVSAGATAFTGLSDVSSASLTVDKIYLPAITMLTVTNNGASAYRFDQYGTTDDPTIYAINGTTIAFNLQASGHPFLIQDGTGTNYNTGLVHVTTGGVVSTGSSAQGKDSGTLYWKIPDTVAGSYRYQCGSHAAMIGNITIKNFGSL
jgi:plastocyanin